MVLGTDTTLGIPHGCKAIPAPLNRVGTSGNPGGRPKRGLKISEHLADLIEHSDVKFYELKGYLESREKRRRLGQITMAKLLAARMIVQAYEGNSETMKEILLRLEGRIRDELNLAQPPVILVQSNVNVSLPSQQDLKVLPEGQYIMSEQIENG